MRNRCNFLIASVLLFAPLTALADCGSAEPLFSAGFERTQAFTLSGSVVGLYQGEVEVRAGSVVLDSAQLSYAGTYALEVPAVAPEAMLNIRVRGIGDQDFLELAAHVGSAGHLEMLARADGGMLGEHAHAALVITARSTVNYALVTAEAGVAGGPDCRLAEWQAALDPVDVAQRMAWLKIVMRDGGFGARPLTQLGTRGGSGTTLDLLLDPVAYEDEIERLETDAPGLLNQYTGLMQESFCDYFQSEQRIVLRDRDLDLSAIYAARISFDAMDAGRFVSTNIDDTFSFTCADDVARLEFSGTSPAETWAYVGGVLTRIWRYEDVAEYRLLDVDVHQVALVQTTQGRMTYPDLPDRPDLVFGGTSYRSALIREPAGNAFDPANEPGEYSLPLHVYGNTEMFFRTLLNADGTGSLIDHDEPLTWSVAPDGSLHVVLADRQVHLQPFRNDGPARDVFVTVTLPGGALQVDAQLAYQRDPVAVVTGADLPTILQSYGDRYNTLGTPFQFHLQADTTATNSQGRIYGWVLEGDRLILRGCASPSMPLYAEPAFGACFNYERRVFDVFQRDGDFWYVHESRDTFQDFYGNGLELQITQRINRPYGRMPISP